MSPQVVAASLSGWYFKKVYRHDFDSCGRWWQYYGKQTTGMVLQYGRLRF